jgi:YggT family protein
MFVIYFTAFIRILFDLLSFLIIVRVLMSWFPQRPHNSFFDFIIDVTNPVMDLAKKITPPLGMIDISPIIALFALDLLKMIILALFNAG